MLLRLLLFVYILVHCVVVLHVCVCVTITVSKPIKLQNLFFDNLERLLLSVVTVIALVLVVMMVLLVRNMPLFQGFLRRKMDGNFGFIVMCLLACKNAVLSWDGTNVSCTPMLVKISLCGNPSFLLNIKYFATTVACTIIK